MTVQVHPASIDASSPSIARPCWSRSPAPMQAPPSRALSPPRNRSHPGAQTALTKARTHNGSGAVGRRSNDSRGAVPPARGFLSEPVGTRLASSPSALVGRPRGVAFREGPFSASTPPPPRSRSPARLARPPPPIQMPPSERCHTVTNRCHLADQTTLTKVSIHSSHL